MIVQYPFLDRNGPVSFPVVVALEKETNARGKVCVGNSPYSEGSSGVAGKSGLIGKSLLEGLEPGNPVDVALFFI